MVNKLLFLVCFFPWVQASPDNENYYNLTPTQFFALAEVNQTISVKTLDKELLEASVFCAACELRLKHKNQHLPTPLSLVKVHAITLIISKRLVNLTI